MCLHLANHVESLLGDIPVLSGGGGRRPDTPSIPSQIHNRPDHRLVLQQVFVLLLLKSVGQFSYGWRGFD